MARHAVPQQLKNLENPIIVVIVEAHGYAPQQERIKFLDYFSRRITFN